MDHFSLGKKPCVFQQDLAPAHKVKMVQEQSRPCRSVALINRNLSPLDYSIRVVLEAKTCATAYISLHSIFCESVQQMYNCLSLQK